MKRFAKRLKGLEISLITTLEPGGTRIGKDIRKILLDSRNKNLSPLTELILYAADRAQHVAEVIKPALTQGKWVICDRFFDATVVYQGIARGQDMNLIRTLNAQVTQGIQPDITFLLDCPVDMGLNRALERNEAQSQKGQDRFEREAMGFHRAVREGYLDLARKNQDRFVIVDAALPKDEVEKKIFQHIEPHLQRNR
ncbi:MAG: thymidylate kinase [Nitrospira bacterium SG8_3]|nr:MAG: thymidylate kinase [Nitrospira bacterium SG8_3]